MSDLCLVTQKRDAQGAPSVNIFLILGYKYSSITPPEYMKSTLLWFRKEGVYQTLWYIWLASHLCRVNTPPIGLALINHRFVRCYRKANEFIVDSPSATPEITTVGTSTQR